MSENGAYYAKYHTAPRKGKNSSICTPLCVLIHYTPKETQSVYNRRRQMNKEAELKGIGEVRRDYELRTGKPLSIYKAYPEIGRGGVDHDQPSHAEVERMFDRALNPPLFERIRNFFRGWRFAPYAV